MIESDTRGIDALSGETDANVAQVQPLLFHQLMEEMADQFPVAPLSGPDLEFDDEPWRQLPTMEDLEGLWLVAPAVDIMIHKLALKVHGEGPDLPKFIATQRDLAAMELQWIREREAENAANQAADIGGPGEAAAVASAAGLGSGRVVPGGSENSGPVGKSRKARGKANSRGASPVHGG